MTQNISLLIEHLIELTEPLPVDQEWLLQVKARHQNKLFSNGIVASLIYGFARGIFEANQINDQQLKDFEKLLHAQGFNYLVKKSKPLS